ncbi:hypothetical protein AYL99_09444 [Fonsecaea erecta]|uniref:Xylanolytic transcriptional activator regulatory domain-containing protein n=1 Tax=Fonsecaea erecta TaxID=1367422 RepID=A0A178ZB01_9EURO|nr:hypothetical protein AYL99_09444 [Fonsecaea erecta]OAP56265.1 hypothetical protein AYL99_09444 [Fonsecaea erecta]
MALNIPTPLLLVFSAALQAVVLRAAAPQYAPFDGFNLVFLYCTLVNWALWFFYLVVIYPSFISPLRDLPIAPGSYPIIGHALSQFKPPRGADYRKFTREVPNDGLIRLRGFLNADQVLVTSPKALAEILVTRSYEFPKPDRDRVFLRRLIGDGLVVAEGDQHKHQRKHSMPSFAFRQIKLLYNLFWEKSVKMTQVIDAEAFGPDRGHGGAENLPAGAVDIEYYAPKTTLDIIGVAGLGRDFNTLGNSDDEMVKIYDELVRPSVGRQIHAAVSLLGSNELGSVLCRSVSQHYDRLNAQLRQICRQFVREKRERMKTSQDQAVDTLASLIKSDIFSDEELVDQLLTIIAAGHETTSSSFSWVAYLLALHPDIQARLRAEIHAAIPNGFSSTDSQDTGIASVLESLPLLNGVCSEALRFMPAVPVTMRTTKRDTTLMGHPVAAGTKFIMSPWAVNNDPELWGPDAHEFKPERWIDLETGKPNQTGGASTNYATLTFLHGQRSCIGQNFARAELRALVAAFAGAFEWALLNPDEEVVPAGVITSKPRDGLKVTLKRPNSAQFEEVHVWHIGPEAEQHTTDPVSLSADSNFSTTHHTSPALSDNSLFIDQLLHHDRHMVGKRTYQKRLFEVSLAVPNFLPTMGQHAECYLRPMKIMSLARVLGHGRVGQMIDEIRSVVTERLENATKIFWSPGSALLRRDADLSEDLREEYIQAYFRYVHPVYPFLDQQSFLEEVSNPQFGQLQRNHPEWSALYNTVLALGCQYHGRGTFFPGKGLAWHFFMKARECFPKALGPMPTLLHVQTVTAMAIFSQNMSSFQFKEDLLSEAARLARCLQLHKSDQADESRTFWVIYQLEKSWCFQNSRTSLIADFDIDCLPPTTPDPLRSGHDWFLSSVRLARLLSVCYEELFSVKATMSTVDQKRSKIQTFYTALQTWKESIPAQWRPDIIVGIPDGQGPESRAVLIHLNFTYYSIVIALARLAIHCGIEGDLSGFGTGEVMLRRAARAILELTSLIDLKAYTSLWALTTMPLAAMLILFDLVIQDPTSADAKTNLLFLDMASGYFSRLELVTDAAMQTSRLSEFTYIAREYHTKEMLRLQTDQSDPSSFPGPQTVSLLLGQSTISSADLEGLDTNGNPPPGPAAAATQPSAGLPARDAGDPGMVEDSIPTATLGGAMPHLPLAPGQFSFEDLFNTVVLPFEHQQTW